ncbi:MAG: cytochrome C [Nitrospirota bacterium]
MNRGSAYWLLVLLCFGAFVTAGIAAAPDPAAVPQRKHLQNPQLDPKLVQRSDEEIRRLIKRGDELWHDRNLGTNGMACNMCHPDATVTHPETFPKFKSQLGRVITVQEMVNWCIQVPLQGKAFPLGNAELTALEAYMNDQNKGQVMEIGLPSP